MPVDLPAAGRRPEVSDRQLDGLGEGAVPVVSGDIHPGLAEPDHIRPAVTRQISKEPRMPIDPPAPGGEAKVRNSQLGR